MIAVLDWELSTLGDPLSDLAYNCLPHHLSPDFPVLKGNAKIARPPMNLGFPNQGRRKVGRRGSLFLCVFYKWHIEK